MQLALLILISLVYLADDATSWTPWHMEMDPWLSIGLSVFNVLLVSVLIWVGLVIGMQRLRRHGSWKAIQWADISLRANVWAVLLVQAFNIAVLGFLDSIRALTGNIWLGDEILAMLPGLLAWVAGWAAYYPFHRYILERLLIRHLDQGLPVYPIQTRWGYAASQAKLHFGLILAPAMVILGWVEGVDQASSAAGLDPTLDWAVEGVMALGVLVIFLLAPVILTSIWSTKPLAEGSLRDRLVALLRRHGVRLRNILVWNTNGTMINGAILGVFPRIRYVLLSDALLDSMNAPEIEAVMAHEVGHAKRHHLPWLALCLLASLAIGSFATDSALRVLPAQSNDPPRLLDRAMLTRPVDQVTIPPWSMAGTLVIGLLVFGWVSRRFERQADTFAVQHLSGAVDGDGQASVIAPEAALAMASALGRVAALNHIPLKRRSWRHGSIAWRQAYLHDLIGRDAHRLRIDRTIRWLKVGAVMVLVAAGSFVLWSGGGM